MRTMQLGKTCLSLSAIGLGGVQFSKVNVEQVAAIIRRARALGINWLETAYGYFDSEEKIGAAVDGDWTDLRIISKNPLRDAEGFTSRVRESLQRLRVPAFDLYQFHGVDNEEAWEQILAPGGTLEAARALQAEGVIKHLGVTSHNLDLAWKMLDAPWVESIQLPISFVHREVADSGFLAAAAERNIGMLAMKPFGGGRLESSRLCLGYVYGLPNVLPIAGVEEIWQVEDLAAVAENPPALTLDDLAEMRHIEESLGKFFCRACRYCEPCPQEITIFTALYFPVYIKQSGVERMLGNGEPSYITAARACTECGACEERCPFHLHIREGLKESIALCEKLLASASR